MSGMSSVVIWWNVVVRLSAGGPLSRSTASHNCFVARMSLELRGSYCKVVLSMTELLSGQVNDHELLEKKDEISRAKRRELFFP